MPIISFLGSLELCGIIFESAALMPTRIISNQAWAPTFPPSFKTSKSKGKKIEASSKNCRRFEASVLYPEPTPLRLDFAGHCNTASLYLLHAGYMLVLRGRECKN